MLLLEMNMECDEFSGEEYLTKRHKIVNQIAIYSLKLKKIEQIGHQARQLKGVQILVSDIMKSMSVYLVTFDPNQASGSKFASMRNSQLKYRFPFGQWCLTSEKIETPIPSQEYFTASFFDQSFTVLCATNSEPSL